MAIKDFYTKEQRSAYNKAWRLANIEKSRKYQCEYHQRKYKKRVLLTAEEKQDHKRVYYQKRKQKLKEDYKNNVNGYRDKMIARSKKRYEDNREKHKAYSRSYYAKNRIELKIKRVLKEDTI